MLVEEGRLSFRASQTRCTEAQLGLLAPKVSRKKEVLKVGMVRAWVYEFGVLV